MTHPQNLVPGSVFWYLAGWIRADMLDGEDLHDIVFGVDHGEEIPLVGSQLFVDLAALSEAYDVSAAFLVDEALVVLGCDREVA